MAAITATCSCRSSCCQWWATSKAISTRHAAHLHTGHSTLCDFLSCQQPLLFLQTCGRQIAPTLIRSIARYGVTSSSECISRSCTALTNWRSVCWTFGTAWTRASLTMQLTGDVSVLERVYGQKGDILSSCCKPDNSNVKWTAWQDIIRFIKHDVSNLSQIWTLTFHR